MDRVLILMLTLLTAIAHEAALARCNSYVWPDELPEYSGSNNRYVNPWRSQQPRQQQPPQRYRGGGSSSGCVDGYQPQYDDVWQQYDEEDVWRLPDRYELDFGVYR